MLKTVEMMRMPFVNSSMEELVGELDDRLGRSLNTFVVTANTEIIMHARKDRAYFDNLTAAEFVIPDGIGVVIGSKIIGNPIEERLTGFDLMIRLFHLCTDKDYSVYFLGAESAVIEETVDRVDNRFPSLKIAGYHHGYFDPEDQSVLKEIQAAEPDVILVGLGVPRQEEWIAQHRELFPKGLFIGVGGSFDVLAGKVKRAPIFWQKLNLEWLYRLIQRPSRWKRMTVLPVFLIKAIMARMLGRKL
ncbi:MAG TPA: WecB/TagA/CpsF family glycosyltransferase [Bacillales bacterium]